jgi:hypothetical protein
MESGQKQSHGCGPTRNPRMKEEGVCSLARYNFQTMPPAAVVH